jgi:tetratricopeptide (TPR) repeat protein
VSETLFEQYKAALRRGHLAALAGELEQALAAYDDAAHLVPERALPLASRGTVLHRLDRWTEAADAFDRALQLAPDDEATLRARATAREERGLRSGAAADFERLAFVLDVAGRATLAAEAARRAADLEPSGARAALAERLETAAARLGDVQAGSSGAAPAQDVRAAAGWAQPGPADTAAPGDAAAGMLDDPWSAALDARRLAALADGSGRASERGGTSLDEGGAGDAGAYDALDALRAGMDAEAPEPAEPAPDALDAAADADAETESRDEVGAEPAAFDPDVGEPGAETGGVAEGQAVDGSWPGIDLPSPPPPPIEGPPPEPEELLREAALVLESGEVDAARDLMLTAIRVHREAGRIDAALDIALNVLAIAPGDPRVHLAIANLQLDRGWTGVATEKIELLVRLTSLTGDTQAEADVHGLASERLRDDPAPTSAGG